MGGAIPDYRGGLPADRIARAVQARAMSYRWLLELADMLRAVIASFDASASPKLREAAGHVLALATAGDARPPAPERLLAELQGALARIEATVARVDPDLYVVNARGRRRRRGAGAPPHRGGAAVLRALREEGETHYRVHPELIARELEAVREDDGPFFGRVRCARCFACGHTHSVAACLSPTLLNRQHCPSAASSPPPPLQMPKKQNAAVATIITATSAQLEAAVADLRAYLRRALGALAAGYEAAVAARAPRLKSDPSRAKPGALFDRKAARVWLFAPANKDVSKWNGVRARFGGGGG